MSYSYHSTSLANSRDQKNTTCYYVEDFGLEEENEDEKSSSSEISSEEERKSKIAKDDWNEQFQSLIQLSKSPNITDKLRSFSSLTKLANNFSHVSENYGRIIISELHLPYHAKSLKPLNNYGIASGQKFVVNNIFFKFVLDSQQPTGSWIYGGSKRNDEKAMKSGLNELKVSIASVFSFVLLVHFFLLPRLYQVYFNAKWMISFSLLWL